MAKRARGYYRGKARGYASKGYGYAKRSYGKSGLNLTMPFLAGLAGAFFMPANPQVDMAAVAVACAPIKGFGKFKGVAQGYALGQACQHYLLPQLGINIPDLMNASNLFGQGVKSAGNVI